MRLPVILVQNPPASGSALAEALVGNLIGRAGLDLTLVDRFDTLTTNSTDRMTLDGITVPSAVLDWQSESEIHAALASIDFHGVRWPHQLDPIERTESGPSNRRLFLFDLTNHQDANAIVAELDRLRESLSVKTISLGAIGSGNGKRPDNGSGPKPAKTTPVNADAVPVAVVPDVGDTPSVTPSATPSPVPDVLPPGSVRSDENLDALLDQLDDLDV